MKQLNIRQWFTLVNCLILLLLNIVNHPQTAVAAQQASSPVFSAIALDGKEISSTKLTGKAYVVNFFASWCPPCRAEIPDMVAMQTKYGNKGFTFIGIAVNENESNMRSFITSQKINYPVVMADSKLIGEFNRYVDGGLSAIPTSIVVNASGKVIQVITGARSKSDFEKIITGALKKDKKS